MKILHTADWHLGAKLGTYDRLEEQTEVLAEIVRIADQEQVDLVLIAGDLFDTFNPGSAAEDLLYRTLVSLTNRGQRAVIAIAGNHDSPEKVVTTVHMARSLGILLVGAPNVVPDQINVPGHVTTAKVSQGFVELDFQGLNHPVRILTTPYANDKRMMTFLGREEDENQTTIEDLLRSHWAGLAADHCDQHGVNLLVAHQFMTRRGGHQYAEPEGERKVLHVGGTLGLHTDIIPEGIQYVALGHLHNKIEVQTSPMPVVYSSSPLAYSFSEAGQTKFVSIIEVEPGTPADVRFVPLSAGKRLMRQTFLSAAEAVEWLTANQDCLVEVSIKTKESLTAAEVSLIKRAHPGIIGQPIPIAEDEVDGSDNHLRLNRILAESGLDIGALFRDYYKSVNQQEPNPELLALFDELVAQDEDQA